MEKAKFIEEVKSKKISVGWLAKRLGCSYGGISRCATKPQAGVAYDPEVINFDELFDFIERNKLDLDKIDFNSYEPKVKHEAIQVNVNDKLTIGGSEYTVITVTKEAVCLRKGEELRALTFKTLNKVVD